MHSRISIQKAVDANASNKCLYPYTHIYIFDTKIMKITIICMYAYYTYVYTHILDTLCIHHIYIYIYIYIHTYIRIYIHIYIYNTRTRDVLQVIKYGLHVRDYAGEGYEDEDDAESDEDVPARSTRYHTYSR